MSLFSFFRRSAPPARRPVVIVRRQSPNWANVGEGYWRDLAEFERMLKRPEGSVRRLIENWDRRIRLPFFEVRRRMAEITDANLARQGRASIIDLETFRRGIDGRAIYTFIDDDDWFDPDLAQRLAALPIGGDGVVWRSVRYAGRLEVRELDGYCHTNNYAVLGSSLVGRPEAAALAEQHFRVIELVASGELKLDLVDVQLSITNKHPASTLMMERAAELYGEDGPRRWVEDFKAAMREPLDGPELGLDWAAPEIDAVRALVEAL